VEYESFNADESAGEDSPFEADAPFGEDRPQEHPEGEIVEAVAVLGSVRALEPVRVGPPPLVQAAAAVATGFVAGAATAAVLTRRREARRLLSPARGTRQLPTPKASSGQTFLVHVQPLRRP